MLVGSVVIAKRKGVFDCATRRPEGMLDLAREEQRSVSSILFQCTLNARSTRSVTRVPRRKAVQLQKHCTALVFEWFSTA